MREVELPAPHAHRLELVLVIPEEQGLVRRRRILVTSPLGEHAPPVDDPIRKRRPRQLHQGWQDVDRHRRSAADGARWNDLRIANDHRYANPSLERRPLRFPQPTGRPRMIAVVDPGSVVAGEEHDRVVENAVSFERFRGPAPPTSRSRGSHPRTARTSCSGGTRDRRRAGRAASNGAGRGRTADRRSDR